MSSSEPVLAENTRSMDQQTVQDSVVKEKVKTSKQYKLSARMALLSKGGQKNNILKPTAKDDKESTSENIESPEMVTSDYDSCFEIETDVEGGGGSEVGRRVDVCEYDDADSGVIESAAGTVAMGTDLGVRVCGVCVLCEGVYYINIYFVYGCVVDTLSYSKKLCT